MKPALRRITINPEYSFSVRKDTGTQVYSMWHHHPEIELFLIRGGKGLQIVGDKTSNFTEACHMIVTGPYLPHTLVYDQAPGHEVEAVVVHFDPHLFGKTFLNLPEMKPVRELLEQTACGLEIRGRTLELMEKQLFELYEAGYTERLLMLIRILYTIASEKEYDVIASTGFAGDFSLRDNTRLNRIYQFTFGNFQRSVTIDEVASQLNLSKESFCRYFKMKTGKTYIRFLMEVRIGHACKLLMENEMNVAEICFACGYNNASNFHHQFKAIKGVTPYQYQKDYLNTARVEEETAG